jgi:hypothetical protein
MKLPISWDLPKEIIARFGQTPGRQRAMFADGHLLLVLHKAPTADERERRGAFFWRKPNGEWESSERGRGLQALRAHVEEYDTEQQRLESEYKDADDARDYFRVLERAAPLSHAAQSLHDVLQTARETIRDDRDIIDLRDWAYQIERGYDLLYTDTKNALDYSIAKRAEEEAQLSRQAVQTGHRLNVLAAIFFPLTAIASLFGMNLCSGLEDSPTWVFWVVFLAGIAVGLVVREWVLGNLGGRTKAIKRQLGKLAD